MLTSTIFTTAALQAPFSGLFHAKFFCKLLQTLKSGTHRNKLLPNRAKLWHNPHMLLKPQTQSLPKTAQTSSVQARTLAELDLDHELLEQYKNAKDLLDDIKDDTSIAPNQKAQTINSISSILSNIIKTQSELHNVERLKMLENTLIETLQKPEFEKLKESFLQAYEKALKAL
jgi:hypothetical protein